MAALVSLLGSDVPLQDLQRCNPNNEDCSNVLEEEYEDFAVKLLGWSAFFKVIVPDIVATLMYQIHAMNTKTSEFIDKNDGKNFYSRSHDWWISNGFTQHNWAWLMVAISFTILYWVQMTFFFLWMSNGFMDSALGWWIEHMVSNLNWFVYGFGLWFMVVAVIDDKNGYAYSGALLYTSCSVVFFLNELKVGTDALRFLYQHYWDDRYLLPSFLYLIGILEHKDRPTDYGYESDESKSDVDQEIEELSSNDLIAL